ncbi:Hypothetical_protein [Hexamita inflata]|uniref:Hypothetical_protein n=1 Tax=Hexamita inflata TaxID=28002 RepID=A0AA86P9D5_9EUKA|nr:Hypothetical protein HINF_LOCUS21980 [Hexamita inflata]
MYSNKILNFKINSSIFQINTPSFSLFGFSSNIQIVNSNIYVQVSYHLEDGALLCFNCSVETSQSNFSFIASGHNISALSTGINLNISSCFIQFRISGKISGIVSSCQQITIFLNNLNISGYFLVGKIKGIIFGYLYGPARVQISNVKVCSNEIKIVGGGDKFITTIGSITSSCDICNKTYFAYGICMPALLNAEVIHQKLVCKSGFIFDGQCSCQSGQLIYENTCVDIINLLDGVLNTQSQIPKNMNQVDFKIANNVLQQQSSSQQSTSQISKQVANLYTILNNQWNLGTLTAYNLQQISNHANYLRQAFKCQRQYGYQYINNKCIHIICPIKGQQSINGVCQCTDILASVNSISGQCECPTNSKSIAAVCTCVIPETLMINNVCVCKTFGAFIKNDQCSCGTNGFNDSLTCKCYPGQRRIGYDCVYIVQDDIFSITCNQILYLNIWDIVDVTKQISSFTSGYAISSAQITNNAYIGVNDNILVGSIFQSQNTFSNIKIQLGSQSFGSVSMLQPTTVIQILINQMNIISKAGSSLTVSSYLYILQSSSSNTNINNMSVNLNFVISSQGNITLINNIKCLNIATCTSVINGYQVQGKYYSTKTIAMIGFIVTLQNISNVAFSPNSYKFGNSSSYLISTCLSGTFSNISVILGNNTEFLQVFSTSNEIYFGGIITYVDVNELIINTILLDCHQIYQNTNIKRSGILIGSDNGMVNTIIISNACFHQNIKGNVTFDEFGIIGVVNSVQIHQSVILILFNGTFQSAGMFGMLNILYIQNSQVTIKYYDTKKSKIDLIQFINYNILVNNTNFINCDGFNGLISGTEQGYNQGNTTIVNTTIQNSNISNSHPRVGMTVGFNTTIYNSSIISSNVSAGGFFKECQTKFTIIRNSSIIKSVTTGSGFIGKVSTPELQKISVYIQNSTVISSTSSSMQIHGAFIGYIENATVSITNSTVTSSIVSSAFVGSITNGTVYIDNSTVIDLRVPLKYFNGVSGFIISATNSAAQILNSNITGYSGQLSNSGVVFVNSVTNSAIKIYKSTITNINLNGNFKMIVFTSKNSTFDLQQSFSHGTNQIDGKTIANCENFNNATRKNGC